jgi:hypothetical protein
MTSQLRDNQLSELLIASYEKGIWGKDVFPVTSLLGGAGNGTPDTIKLSGRDLISDSMKTIATSNVPSVTISTPVICSPTEKDLYKKLGWNMWKRLKLWLIIRKRKKLLLKIMQKLQQRIEDDCERLILGK